MQVKNASVALRMRFFGLRKEGLESELDYYWSSATVFVIPDQVRNDGIAEIGQS